MEKGSPVITHYAMFEAVVRIVKEYSNNIVFGDSPGSGDTKMAAEKSELMEVANRYGVKFVDFNNILEASRLPSLISSSWLA